MHHVSNAKKNTGDQAIPENRILTLIGTLLAFSWDFFWCWRALFKLTIAPEISQVLSPAHIQVPFD